MKDLEDLPQMRARLILQGKLSASNSEILETIIQVGRRL